jgi:undecaprenyl-diphosphatase
MNNIKGCNKVIIKNIVFTICCVNSEMLDNKIIQLFKEFPPLYDEEEVMNKYYLLGFSILLLIFFILFAIMVSPKFNHTTNSLLISKDTYAFLKINNSHYPAFNQFMILLTEYGREVVWSIAIILLFIIGGWTGKKTALVMGLAMLVLIPVVNAAKEIVARPRPIIPQTDFLIAADSKYAFPSGHATIVSAGAAVVLMLFRGSAWKLAISLSLSTEAALVCFSRVYVGGHYPLDVFGGIFLGVGVALIFIAVTNYGEVLMLLLKRISKKS